MQIETIYKSYQTLFPFKNKGKKYFKMCSAENFIQTG